MEGMYGGTDGWDTFAMPHALWSKRRTQVEMRFQANSNKRRGERTRYS